MLGNAAINAMGLTRGGKSLAQSTVDGKRMFSGAVLRTLFQSTSGTATWSNASSRHSTEIPSVVSVSTGRPVMTLVPTRRINSTPSSKRTQTYFAAAGYPDGVGRLRDINDHCDARPGIRDQNLMV